MVGSQWSENYGKNGEISLFRSGTTLKLGRSHWPDEELRQKWLDLNGQIRNYAQNGGISSVRCGTTLRIVRSHWQDKELP